MGRVEAINGRTRITNAKKQGKDSGPNYRVYKYKGYQVMTIQDLMAIGGGIVLFANVVNVIYKWLSPAFKIKRGRKNKELIARLQAHDSKDYELFAEMREISRRSAGG